MRKNDLVLQLFFLILTAAIISLLVAKFYPSHLFEERQVHAEVAEKAVAKTLAQKKEQVIPPDHIVIASVGIDLPVAPGVIVDNMWSLFDDKASWLATSKTPGRGNVIIYAHNREHLFAALKKAVIGDAIVVFQADKKITYHVSEIRKIKPTDVEEILSDKDQLTLYTCDGAFDQKRLVVIATPTVY